MKAKLQEQMKDAMRAKDKVRLDTIRGLISVYQYEAIQKTVKELTDAQCVEILQRELKKRRESLEFAEKSGRSEMIEQIRAEMKIVEEFLPKQLTGGELETIIAAMKKDNSATNMGDLMKALKAKYAGQYDGKLASEIAKKVLG